MNKKLIIIIAAVLVVGGGVAAFLLLGGEKETPIVRTEHILEQPFVVNIKESRSLMKCSVTVVLNTDTISEDDLALMNARMYDTILLTLRDSTEDDLRAIDLSPLKQKIVRALNERFEFESVMDIEFTSFAIQ